MKHLPTYLLAYIRFTLTALLVLSALNLFSQGEDEDHAPDDYSEYEDEELDPPVERLIISPCSQYTELGSTVEVWDWRVPTYKVVYYGSNTNMPITRNIDSPFFTFGPNINHLGALTMGEPSDFEPSDGWELLYRNLGKQERPVNEPSFGLYNRLDGRIRILFYIEPDNGNPANNVLVRLSTVQNSGRSNATSLFENLNLPQNALRNFDKEISFSGMAQLNKGESGGEWYILEGIVNYDPCICNYESAMIVVPTLTNISSLAFDMQGTGESTANYTAGSSASTLGKIPSVAGKISSGIKKYQDGRDYLEDAEKNTGKTIVAVSSAIAGILGVGSGVADLIGFLTGKNSGSVSPKLSGFNHDFTFEASGSLEENDPYDSYNIYTPGSFYNRNRLENFRPVYDNPLGIFTVLESPIVEFTSDVTESFVSDNNTYLRYENGTIRWRFSGGLRYHVNSLAGISNQPVELLASLVWPSCDNEDDFYATPAINITCLEDFVVEFDVSRVEGRFQDPGSGIIRYINEQSQGVCSGPPQLQVVAVLKSDASTGEQEILYTARYKTTAQELPVNSIGENPLFDMSAEEISASCTNIVPAPLDAMALYNFCNNGYNPEVQTILPNEDSTNKTKKSSDITYKQFSAFPNPFTNEVNVTFNESWGDQKVSIELHSSLGELISRVDNMKVTSEPYLFSNLSHLSSGIYVLTITGGSFTESLQIVKI